MRFTRIAAAFFALLVLGTVRPVRADDLIVIGEWRTESGKSLVCGGEEGHTLVTIATRANDFYEHGAKKDSPEYEAYWSALEKALQEGKCFVAAKMHHMPDTVVYTGPEDLEPTGKRFKVIGTTIKEDGNDYPAFTMTTLKVK